MSKIRKNPSDSAAQWDASVLKQPDFSDLYLLTIIDQTRSYTQAAKRLGVSKASVSQRITALERAAGVPLVQRSTRSVALTPAGLQLSGDITSSFSRIEQSFAAVRDLASTPRGLLRVTMPVALGRQHVMPALNQFLLNYPEIRIEIDLNDRMVNLVQEGFDLAIRHSQTPPETYVAWPLTKTCSHLVASAAYLSRHGVPEHPHDLSEHACLVYLRGSVAAQSWSLVRKKRKGLAEQVHVPVSGPLKANNSEVLREAAQAGLGIALLPDFSLRGQLAGLGVSGSHGLFDGNNSGNVGNLIEVLPDWTPQGFFGGQIFAMRPWSAKVPRAVQCLVDHLRQHFGVHLDNPRK